MRRLIGLTVALLVVGLLTMTAVPASAQLGDPLSLAASGVILPFFSDPAAGFVSVFELASPIVQIQSQTNPPTIPINPLHAIFYSATCGRLLSAGVNETNKQAIGLISTSAQSGALTTNGLAAIGRSQNGNDLNPLIFPIHSRTHWIDVKTGRLRELEPITVDTFAQTVPNCPGIGCPDPNFPNPPFDTVSLGWTNAFFAPNGSNTGGPYTWTGGPFSWNPFRSGATFVTPQDTASIQGSLILICPRSSLSAFPSSRFPTLFHAQNDSAFSTATSVIAGFPPSNAITGNSASNLRGRIYDDNEAGPFDITIPCDCLTTTNLTAISGVYASQPTNLGPGTVPVWYTELETQRVTVDPTGGGIFHEFSFTGYWNLNVAGHETTLFHRLSTASRANLSGVGAGGIGGAFGSAQNR